LSHIHDLFLKHINNDKLKKAQVTPLYKKNDPLLKTNYRPVSVLCIFSKIFEKILEQQLSDFFENSFNPHLCAFRRGHANFNLLFPI
jgi:retron-type reverse transcriptase